MDNMEVTTPVEDTKRNKAANDEERNLPVNTSSKEKEEEMDEDEADGDDGNNDADESEIKVLEASLIEEPNDYSTHLALITKLQRMGDVDRLRIARENLISESRLRLEIWMSWLRTEIKLAVTPEQRTAVVQLCERALLEYPSVDVWLEYLQFSVGTMGSDAGAAKKIRQLFERASTTVGLHVTKGALVWKAYREFEAKLVSMIPPDNVREKKEQLDRVCSIFRRQLACPLLDMEKTLEEYKIWRMSDGADLTVDENIVSDGYTRALKKLNDRLPYEEKLVRTRNTAMLSDAYTEYLLYEEENGDPGQIIVLYERAIVELKCEDWLWLDYLSYLEENIKIDSILEPVYSRASRSQPSCAMIWQKWMRAMDRWDKPLAEIQAMVEKVLIVKGFPTLQESRNLWITYIEYLRRRIDNKESTAAQKKWIQLTRDTFQRACCYLAKNHRPTGGPDCVILQYWARTEAILANDMEKARSLWSDILSQGHPTAAATWFAYITLEKCYGDTKHLRELYQKALAAVEDWPVFIANSWIDFERDEGTLEQMEICEAEITEKLLGIRQEQKRQYQPEQVDYHGCNSYFSRRAKKRKPNEVRCRVDRRSVI